MITSKYHQHLSFDIIPEWETLCVDPQNQTKTKSLILTQFVPGNT